MFVTHLTRGWVVIPLALAVIVGCATSAQAQTHQPRWTPKTGH